MLRRGLILINGNIYTFDGQNPRAKALLALDGRVEYAGEDLDPGAMGVEPGKSNGWMTVIDLEGKTVLPGFIDSHTHLLLYAKSLRELDLRRARSLSATLEAVGAKAKEMRAGHWVLGRGWNADRWNDEGIPHRRHLDGVCAQHPVLLRCHDEHAVWVNTLAMKVAGITRDTKDPAGGEIVRDKNGEPTGIFKEAAAEILVRAVPETSFSLQRDLMANAVREIVRRGVTAVYDHEGAAAFKVLADLHSGGLLPLRVTESFRAESLETSQGSAVVPGFGNDFLRIGGLKLFVDGSLSSRTAWMWEPYADGSGSGAQRLSREELSGLIRKAAEIRMPLVLHAIGDRAVSSALDLIEEYRVREPHPRLPHRIEHAQTVRPEDFPRFKKLDVVASLQPVHLLDDFEAAKKALGSRIATTFAAKSFLEHGVEMTFGSDLPIAPFDPLLGIFAATQRRRPDAKDGETFSPEQAIPATEAVRAYTSAAAQALGLGEKIGRLAEGLFADCVVLSKDPFKCTPEELLSTHVEMTLVDGRVVYDRRGMTKRELI